jgi:hypothetical protein
MSFITNVINTAPDRNLQKASIAAQYQQILVQIDRRLRSALAKGDRPLYNQLASERGSHKPLGYLIVRYPLFIAIDSLGYSYSLSFILRLV